MRVLYCVLLLLYTYNIYKHILLGIVPPKVPGEDSHTIIVERVAKSEKREQLKARR